MLSLVSGGKLSANKTAYKANKLTAATVHVEAVSTYISNNTTGICQPGNSINNLGAVTGTLSEAEFDIELGSFLIKGTVEPWRSMRSYWVPF